MQTKKTGMPCIPARHARKPKSTSYYLRCKRQIPYKVMMAATAHANTNACAALPFAVFFSFTYRVRVTVRVTYRVRCVYAVSAALTNTSRVAVVLCQRSTNTVSARTVTLTLSCT